VKKTLGDLITQTEAAELRGVELATVNQWVRRKRVPSYLQFGKRLVSRAEVLAYDPEANKGGRPPKPSGPDGRVKVKKGGKK
jgi:excisionase family DNA binding protein